MRYAWLLLALGVIAGCRFDQGGLGFGGDGGGPTADASTRADAAVGIDARTGIDAATGDDSGTCTTTCLNATQLRDCSQGGATVTCPLGCGGANPHCESMVPSNGATETDLMGVTAGISVPAGSTAFVTVDDGEITIDGDTVRNAGTGVVDGIRYEQRNGLGIIAVNRVSMGRGSSLRLSGNRPVILLSAGDVTIDGGTLDLSGGCYNTTETTCGGPGGGNGGFDMVPAGGCGPGGDGMGGGGDPESGGGGGGMGAAGGKGGDGSASQPGGAGGTTAGCAGPTLVPLGGGSGGGHGGGGNQVGGNGGGGGGAVQITSFTRITMTKSGPSKAVIDAGGSGGAGDNGNGGGGAGSGGGILLEAPEIMISASTVVANGGGGGDGDSGTDGESGTLTSSPAAGGDGGNPGGDGGALGVAAQPGTGPIDGAGGGGGGVGIIRFNVPAAGLTLMNQTISPAHTRGDLTLQ